MSTEQIKTHRYPGVKPFSENERHVFYGRTTDTKKLYQLINLEKLVLLYSKSGLGKSSLLNAGVLPLFDEAEGYTTIKIRLGACFDQSLSPIATSLFKLPEASLNPVLDKLGAGSDTLWLRMKGLQHNDADVPQTYILVFDQFEELFTYSQEDIKQFKRQLADLLYAKVPGYISKSLTNRLRENPEFLSNEELEFLYRQPAVKVVLSIRSDRMSLLNTLADYLPDIQKSYYELKPLDRDSAIDSIVKPAIDKSDLYLSPPFGYTTDCLNKILDYLTQSGQKSIETFQLQTVCQFTENLAMESQLQYDEKKQMLLAEPGVLGDLQNIFRTQYDKLISNIEPIEKQLAARLLIENKLIIDGNRVSLPDVVVLKEKGIDKNLIAYLHDTHHILRSEPNTTSGISYELSHDTLVTPILKAKKEREDKEELARLDKEKHEALQRERKKAEQERLEREKERKRQRTIIGIVSIAAIIAIGLAVFGFVMWRSAETETRKAQSLTFAAFAREQLDKNPTMAIRLAEYAWKTSPIYPPALPVKRIIAEAFYGPAERHKFFYKYELTHGQPVINVAFSPDGKKIVTASADSTVILWDASSGKKIKDLKGHTGGVSSAVFSPDGKQIITASVDSTAIIWDATSGKKMWVLAKHTDWVKSAVFSPDGKKIVTSSWDDTIRIWDVASEKRIEGLTWRAGLVSGEAFSPDGTQIVTAFNDTAIIWDAAAGEKIGDLIGHTGSVNSAAFSPDGKQIVTASEDSTAVIWDAATKRKIRNLTGHTASVYSAVFSPDGKQILTASWDKTAKVWDVPSGKLTADLVGHRGEVWKAVFSPDGKRIVTASYDNTAKIWDVVSGKLTADLISDIGMGQRTIFSPDGKKIATTSHDTAKLWDAATGKKIADLTGHLNDVDGVIFSPDGKQILTTALQGKTAIIWDAATGKKIADFTGLTDYVNGIVFSPDGKQILTKTLYNNTPILWDAATGKKIADLAGHAGDVRGTIFSPNGKQIATTSIDSTAIIWDAATGKKIADLTGHRGIVNDAVFSPDGRKLVTLSYDSTAIIWDATTGKKIADLIGHTEHMNMAVFSPDGKKLATVSDDGTSIMWDAVSGKKVMTLTGHVGNVRSAVFSPDGKQIVTVSGRTAKLWVATSGKLVADLTEHSIEGFEVIRAVAFSPDGKQIMTASSDDRTIIWDAATGKKIADLDRPTDKIYTAAFSSDGKQILTASKIWLTPEGIIDWLKTANIYQITQKDLEDLGIDFIDLKKINR